MKILIIEDDCLLRQGLDAAIKSEGFVCELAESGREADEAIRYGQFSLIILDLGLPDCDGLTLLKCWRKQAVNTPILILTARDTVEDRVAGLDQGADDYLIKPFSLSELQARIRALIRRHQGVADNIIVYGSLKIDLSSHSAKFEQSELLLTPKEFAVLRRLVLKKGEKVHRDVLQNDLYDWQHDPSSNVLEVYIHSLRQKLGKHVIRTIRGYGYQLVLG